MHNSHPESNEDIIPLSKMKRVIVDLSIITIILAWTWLISVLQCPFTLTIVRMIVMIW
jgi:hypothetical protein